MNCCDNISSKCLLVSPCDSGIDTGIVSTYTGNMTVLVEFNGVWISDAISVTLNQNIIIWNILNGNYNHQVKFMLPDGSLLNNTCYYFKVSTVLDSDSGITPTPPVTNGTETYDFEFLITENPDTNAKYTLFNGFQIPAQYQVSDNVVIPYFVGKNVHLPLFINNTLSQDATYDKATGTISYPFYTGDILSGQFEQQL